MSKQEKQLLKLIKQSPDIALAELTKQFNDKADYWDTLALLASLEEQQKITCYQEAEQEPSFRVEQSSNGITTRLKTLFTTFKSKKTNYPKNSQVTKLERLFELEKNPLQKSHYEVELLLAKGHSVAEVSDKTGYSVYWVTELAQKSTVLPQVVDVNTRVIRPLVDLLSG